VKLVAKRAPGVRPEVQEEVREPAREEDPFSVFSPEDAPRAPARQSTDWTLDLGLSSRYLRPVLLVVVPSIAILLGGYFAFPVLKARWGTAAAEARLSVSSNPSGAVVLIDGTRRGVTPLTVNVVAGDHTLILQSGTVSKELKLLARADAELLQHVEMTPPVATTGSLTVTSDPAGLAVTVDGRRQAVTPVTVDGLAPGTHRVAVSGRGIDSERSVIVTAGSTAALVFARPSESALAPGSLTVTSPIDVELFQGDSLIGSSRSARLFLPAGAHTLTAVNDALGFRRQFSVQVTPGSTSRVSISVPNGTLAVNAQPWAQVWVDGKALGDTPIGNISLPIGEHELVLRHPEFGEHRQSVTIGVGRPTRIGIDLRKQGE
jgi:hypothetical protein